jgi:tetratricopeptide (TPR) repeat protein/predicted Ser/Thr protein kinase
MAARDRKISDYDATRVSPESSNPENSAPTVLRVGSSAGAMARATLSEGALLADRYEIVKLLGEGGMGAVYKAKDCATDQFVALKTIRPDLAANEHMLARFKQELILARQVTHRNVVRIYDIGESDGIKFITMEFVEGEDLRTILDQSGKLAPAEAAEIIEQVCRALEAAHAEGVIHRDLKPQNIMREHTGRIVVMDFGLARVSDSSMTQTGGLVGTMEYMSPEQALGTHVDARSDIFAIGVIFYELLSGKSPYCSESAIASLLKRTKEKAVPVSEIEKTVPGSLGDIVSKCLERDCKRRYQRVSAVLADLEAWHGGARPHISRIAFLAFRCRKTYYYVGAGLLAVALVAAGVRVRSGFSHKTSPPAAESAPAVSLAIIPFRNATSDPKLDWIGANIADVLRTDIGQASQLHVVSPENVHGLMRDMRVSAQTQLDGATLRRLAQFTKADQIVFGQYVKFGDQIRVDATVQDLKQQRTTTLKAEAANENDLLGAIDRLAQQVRSNLSLSSSVVEQLQAKAFKPSTNSPDALRYYERGVELMRDGKNLDAVKQFETSLGADSNFALASAKLGESYAKLGYGDKAEDASQRAVDLAQQLPPQERYRILASRALVVNDNNKAIGYYEDLAKVAPDDSDIRLTLAELYENTGNYDTARACLKRVLEREPNYPDALITLAHIEGESHNPQAALEYLNHAMTLAVQLENPELRAKVFYETGYIYRLINKPDEAQRNYDEALAIRHKLGEKAGIAQVLAESAEVQYTLGKPDEAIARYQKAMQLQREVGDKTYLSHTLLNLGGIYSDRGQSEEALKYLKESLQLQREQHNQNYEAMCLINIGNVYLSTARFDDAMTYFQQALDLMKNQKNTGQMPILLFNLGEASSHMGQYEAAMNDYLRGLQLARDGGNKEDVAAGAHGLGRLFYYQGRYHAALSSEEESVNTYRELQDRSASMAEALADYGDTLATVGRNGDARKALDEALALSRENKSLQYESKTLTVQGGSLVRQGDMKGARALYDQALPLALRSKDQETVLLAKLAVAQWTVENGNARQILSELKRISLAADAQGLTYLSTQASLLSAKAMLKTKDYRSTLNEVESVRRTSEKLDFKFINAQARYVQAEALAATGKTSEASQQYAQARQMLQDIGKESQNEGFLKRNDLQMLLAH